MKRPEIGDTIVVRQYDSTTDAWIDKRLTWNGKQYVSDLSLADLISLLNTQYQKRTK